MAMQMKMQVLWEMTLCSWWIVTDVSGELAASNFSVQCLLGICNLRMEGHKGSVKKTYVHRDRKGSNPFTILRTGRCLDTCSLRYGTL